MNSVMIEIRLMEMDVASFVLTSYQMSVYDSDDEIYVIVTQPVMILTRATRVVVIQGLHETDLLVQTETEIVSQQISHCLL